MPEQEIGKLVVKLVAEIGDLKRGLQSATSDIKKFAGDSGQSIGTFISSIKASYFAVAGIVTGAALTLKGVYDFSKSIASMTNDIKRQAAVLNMNVELLQKWQYASKMSDVNATELAQGIKLLSRNMEDASHNTGDAAQYFQAMGISVKDTSGHLRPLNDIMLEIMNKFASWEDGPRKIAIALALFGRSGETLIPLLNKGRSGFEDYAREAEKLGLILSPELIRKGSEAEDIFKKIDAQIQANKLAWAPFSLEIAKAAGDILSATKGVISFLGEIKKAYDAVREAMEWPHKQWMKLGEILGVVKKAPALEGLEPGPTPIPKEAKVQPPEVVDQKKLNQWLLTNEKQRIAARNYLIKSGLESKRVMELAEAKRTSEDTTLLEMDWDKKMAAEELRATKANLVIEQKQEVEAAKDARMDVAIINQKFRDLNLAAEGKYASEVAKINAKLTQERAEALRKAEQAQFGFTFEVQPFAPTAFQTGEMDVRSKNLQLKKDEYDINRKIAETQMEEKLFRISKETALRSEIDLNNQLLSTYEVELENLGIGSEGYSDLQSKIAGTRDKVNELNFSLEEQTASFIKLADLGLKKYAVSLKSNLISTMQNLVPNAIDIAGNSVKGFLKNLSDGTMSVSEAFKQLAKDFGTSIMDMIIDVGMLILKMEILKALGYGTGAGATAGGGGGGGGAGLIGTIISFIGGLFAQTGGPIRGPSGTDIIPVRATAGEYMQPVPAVRYYGLQAMEAIRSRAIPREQLLGLLSGVIPSRRAQPSYALAAGGPIPSEYSRGEKDKVELTFINVSDPRDIDRYLSSAAGQNAVLNVLSSRADTVKKIMR